MAETPDPFKHSDKAAANRLVKARTLARWLWDRGIDGDELVACTPALRRRIARAAGVNPPSGIDTWSVVAEMLDEKDEWLGRHPGHPSGARAHEGEKADWIPEGSPEAGPAREA